MSNHYCVNSLYRARTTYTHYDDQYQDEWQLEVYLHALGLMKKYHLASIIDIGCGSGYKLVTYLGDYQTIGIELGMNVEKLCEKYPNSTWLASDFSQPLSLITDVIICADVIEHLVDPDQLISYIKNMHFQYLIFSTPTRDLMHRPSDPAYYGPPINNAHVREWTYQEFADYISAHFTIIDHRITNLAQYTQMVICQPKAP